MLLTHFVRNKRHRYVFHPHKWQRERERERVPTPFADLLKSCLLALSDNQRIAKIWAHQALFKRSQIWCKHVSMDSLPPNGHWIWVVWGTKAAWHRQCHYLLIPFRQVSEMELRVTSLRCCWKHLMWSHTWFTGYRSCIVYWCILKTGSSIHSDSILSSHASGCACGGFSVLRWFDDFSNCYICCLIFLWHVRCICLAK